MGHFFLFFIKKRPKKDFSRSISIQWGGEGRATAAARGTGEILRRQIFFRPLFIYKINYKGQGQMKQVR